jgi:hypothetical protein
MEPADVEGSPDDVLHQPASERDDSAVVAGESERGDGSSVRERLLSARHSFTALGTRVPREQPPDGAPEQQ